MNSHKTSTGVDRTHCFKTTRRKSLGIQLGLLLVWGSIGEAFDFASLRAQAEALAVQPYQSHTNRVPEVFSRMNYDEYWKISNRLKNYWQRDGSSLGLQ